MADYNEALDGMENLNHVAAARFKGVNCGTPFPARPVLADSNRVRDAL